MEEFEGIAVDLILRRGGEAKQQAVEPVEDRVVFPVHRAVGLVDDDEVEVAGAEHGVITLIDQPHHRRIGRSEDPPRGGLSFGCVEQIDGGDVRQVHLERVGSLLH